MKTIVGLCETRPQAERAVSDLRTAGFRSEDIGIMMRDDVDANAEDAREGRLEGAAFGAIGGGALGALGGLVLGASTLVVPGIGAAVAAGTIASAVIGGALGAGAGGLLGALIDAGLSEDEARHYQAGIERGGVLVTVLAPDSRESEVNAIFRANGVRDMDYHLGLWQENPSHRYDVPSETALDARPGALMRSAEGEGAVLAGGATGAVAGMTVGGLVGGPLGLAVGTALGAVSGGIAGAAIDYRDVEPHFEREWQHGAHHERFDWEQASAAYRYGWESAWEPEFQGRAWRDVRPDLERRWPGGAAWPDVEPLVHNAWDRRTSHSA